MQKVSSRPVTFLSVGSMRMLCNNHQSINQRHVKPMSDHTQRPRSLAHNTLKSYTQKSLSLLRVLEALHKLDSLLHRVSNEHRPVKDHLGHGNAGRPLL